MTSRDFVYWLQGYLEISEDNKGLTKSQVECIQKHLALVFIHEIDPSMPSKALDKKHAEGKKGTAPTTSSNGAVLYRC